MVVVTVLSKQPPGGRCSLYLRYAGTVREQFSLDIEVRYCEGDQAGEAPALLVEGASVEPTDGVIVAPEDLARWRQLRRSTRRALPQQASWTLRCSERCCTAPDYCDLSVRSEGRTLRNFRDELLTTLVEDTIAPLLAV